MVDLLHMTYAPRFHISPHLLWIIEAIAAYRQRIATSTIQVPWIPLLQRDARTRTTHSSTAIEGNPLTLEEVRAIADGNPLPISSERAEKEILNHLAGLRFIETHQKKKTITCRDLLQLHAIIASGVMDQGKAGTYRTFGVRVGYYLPPAAKEVPRLMRECLTWWNQHSTEWSPVISSAILHFHFEEIHPFGDGNGRMGRLLALWELYRRGFDAHHIFSIDEIYWENRQGYYAQLDSVRTAHGDLTGWLEYSAEVLHLTLERVLKRIEHLATHTTVGTIVLTRKQEQLLHMLRSKGGLAPREIWHALNITKQGTAKLLKPLLASGLIQRVGTRKSGKYVIGDAHAPK